MGENAPLDWRDLEVIFSRLTIEAEQAVDHCVRQGRVDSQGNAGFETRPDELGDHARPLQSRRTPANLWGIEHDLVWPNVDEGLPKKPFGLICGQGAAERLLDSPQLGKIAEHARPSVRNLGLGFGTRTRVDRNLSIQDECGRFLLAGHGCLPV
ncbi:hypothetical protein EP7_003711 [Isosphaeraceae bacterium EP7]